MPCILMNAIITRQTLSTIRTKGPRGTFHLRCNETSFANTLLRPRAAIHVLVILVPFSLFLSFLESMEFSFEFAFMGIEIEREENMPGICLFRHYSPYTYKIS